MNMNDGLSRRRRNAMTRQHGRREAIRSAILAALDLAGVNGLTDDELADRIRAVVVWLLCERGLGEPHLIQWGGLWGVDSDGCPMRRWCTAGIPWEAIRAGLERQHGRVRAGTRAMVEALAFHTGFDHDDTPDRTATPTEAQLESERREAHRIARLRREVRD